MSDNYCAQDDLRNKFSRGHESGARELLRVATKNDLIDVLPEMNLKLVGNELLNLEDNSNVTKNTLVNKFTNLTMKVKSMTKEKRRSYVENLHKKK